MPSTNARQACGASARTMASFLTMNPSGLTFTTSALQVTVMHSAPASVASSRYMPGSFGNRSRGTAGHLHFSLEIEHALTLQLDALADQAAAQLAAAARGLIGTQPLLAEFRAPIGHQHAVRRSSHRVL